MNDMKLYAKFVLYLALAIGVSICGANAYVDYFRAVNVDNEAAVSALLAKGFDPNTVGENGQSGLFLAVRDDSPKVAAVLLAHPGLMVDARNSAGETPLMIAALRGNLDAVKQLVARGAKVHTEGWSPLHYAATGESPQVVAFLIERGAAIDAAAPNGNTPLMMAARYGSEDNVKLLLRLGADKKRLNLGNLSAADLAKTAERPWLLPLLQ